MLRRVADRIGNRSRFGLDVATLTAGGLAGQIVVIAASPVLTRLYTPEDVAVLGLLTTIVSMVTPILCGRYEVALLLPKSEANAQRLLGIALRIAIACTLIAVLVAAIAGDRIAAELDAPKPQGWMLLTPVALLLTGVGIALSGMATRLRRFAEVARARLAQSCTSVVVNLGLGVAGAGPIGLIAGLLGGAMVHVLILSGLRPAWMSTVTRWDRRSTLLLRRYRAYPLVNGSSGLLHGITLALPMLVLATHFSSVLVGQYALVVRVATLPLTALTTSISQVHLRRVVDLVASGGSVRTHLIRVVGTLAAIVAPPAAVLMWIAPDLFGWVFGEAWRPGGEYLRILMPAIAIRFLTSAVSTTFGGTGNNGLVMVWRVIAFVTTASVLAWGASTGDATTFFKAFAISEIAIYLLLLALVWRAAGHPRPPLRGGRRAS